MNIKILDLLIPGGLRIPCREYGDAVTPSCSQLTKAQACQCPTADSWIEVLGEHNEMHTLKQADEILIIFPSPTGGQRATRDQRIVRYAYSGQPVNINNQPFQCGATIYLNGETRSWMKTAPYCISQTSRMSV